jgi:hypothetical protein
VSTDDDVETETSGARRRGRGLTVARAATHAGREAARSPQHQAAPGPAAAGNPREDAGAVQTRSAQARRQEQHGQDPERSRLLCPG